MFSYICYITVPMIDGDDKGKAHGGESNNGTIIGGVASSMLVLVAVISIVFLYLWCR